MARLRDFVPGAPTPRDEAPQPHENEDIPGRSETISGTSYYQIGSLAAMLNRAPGTIRDWIRAGVIPDGYTKNPDSRNGRRRLYSARQIILLRQLAEECGIIDDLHITVKGSEFSRLAFLLFDRLRQEEAA